MRILDCRLEITDGIFYEYDLCFFYVFRLTKLQILELRENQLKMLPK